MSYDNVLLSQRILRSLERNPSYSLKLLSHELHVSRRTIEYVAFATKGKRFKELRAEALLAKVRGIIQETPIISIKELTFEVGYKSPRSFARAVRRLFGLTPKQLRSLSAEKIL